jgi:carboxyl-terminal processing protease
MAATEPGTSVKAPKTARHISAIQVALLCALVGSVAFVAGFFLGDIRDSRHNTEDFEVFWQSWDILERDFYFDMPDDQTLIHGAIQGLLATTNDPFTFFAPPAVAEFDRQATAGEFGGIGAYITQNERGQLIITQPFTGMPAAEAGLQDGDIMIAVDGSSTEGWTQEQAVGKLRGEIGTTVELDVFRPSDSSTLSVELVRARVELPTVEAALMDEVGYVRLFRFNEKATSLLADEIGGLLEQGASALILDLRGNPGGLLDQAVSVSDLFLDEGIIVTERYRDGDERVFESATGDVAESIPLAVLVDAGSASASEVVAGAVRDRGRAILVGQTSYGKGSVQHVYNLRDGSQIRVTVAVWLTPGGTVIQGRGLVPDVEVPAGDVAATPADPALDAALEYLNAEQPE